MMGPAAKDAVPALTKALEHEDAVVRRTAANALAKIGPSAKDAVPALTKALEDEDANVRRAAAKALAKIGAKDAVRVSAADKELPSGEVPAPLPSLGPPAERSGRQATIRQQVLKHSTSLVALESDRDAEFSKVARQEVESYRFSQEDGGDANYRLSSAPLLRYTNPVTRSTNGQVFAWTDAERPQVLAAIFEFPERPLSTEFHSLSLDVFSAERDDGAKWTPAAPGVKFSTVPDAALPAKTAVHRRIQMRAIMKRFAVELSDSNGEKYQLRRQDRPLLHYGKRGADTSDGAIFAFVQATNPDALVLLEARRQADGYRWEYALARMHHRTMHATLDGKTVWEVTQLSNSQKESRSGIYTIFRRR